MGGAYPYMDLNAKYGKLLLRYLQNEASAREIATCEQNVGQKEDFVHSNFQMDISLPWIETGYWTRAIKRFALFDLLKSLYSDTKILSKYIPSLQRR